MSEEIPSSTSMPRAPSTSQTASAASSSQPPANTDSRRKSRFSLSLNSSWLHSIAALSVCWRAGASTAPRVSKSSRSSRRPSRACGGSVRMRAAASSMASGSPSRRTQISATAGAFSFVTTNSGRMVWARCTKRATASYCDRVAASGRCSTSGSWRGVTANSCSAARRSGARLVTTNLTSGAAPRSGPMDGPPATSCSKLSSTSRIRRLLRCSVRDSSTVWPVPARTARVWAIVGRIRLGSAIGARLTKKTPSGNSSIASAASWSASRVLPVPPGPVSVRRRTSCRWKQAAGPARVHAACRSEAWTGSGGWSVGSRACSEPGSRSRGRG